MELVRFNPLLVVLRVAARLLLAVLQACSKPRRVASLRHAQTVDLLSSWLLGNDAACIWPRGHHGCYPRPSTGWGSGERQPPAWDLPFPYCGGKVFQH